MSTLCPIAMFRIGATTHLWIALFIVCAMIAIALSRSIELPATSKSLIVAGALMLALACGSPQYLDHRDPNIVVMIDRSASTRGATYLDDPKLKQRLRELIGDRAHTEFAFDGLTFAPPQADAIVLFSDVQLRLPTTAPPTYVIVDPALEQPSDAAVTQLSINANDLRVGVRNHVASNEARRLASGGLLASPALPLGETLGSGSFVFHALRDPASDAIAVRVIGGDRWPENDELRLIAPPLEQRTRWWISDDRSAPDSTWRAMRPGDLPPDAEAYLAPSIIVLDDAPASAISPRQQAQLARYVRDLGGALVIVGGEHAFGAGGYFNTTLDAISPLASAPPTPMRRWIILADSSGSMAGGRRWQSAGESIRRAIRSLPPNDLLTIGSFARDVRWWLVNAPVNDASRQQVPPGDVSPNGPTNLEPALQQIVANANATTVPTELLILSDADTTIGDVAALARQLQAKRVRVDLIATGSELSGDNPVAQLVQATGGQLLREPEVDKWSSRVQDLLRAAMPELLIRERQTVSFVGSVGTPPTLIDLRNRTWVKTGTEEIARIGTEVVGARWNYGSGRVVSLAFPAADREIQSIAAQLETSPRDPRFSVRRSEGAQVQIAIDAIDATDRDRFLNGLKLRLILHGDESGSDRSIPFTQSAPGAYELSIPAPPAPPAPRISTLATIVLDDRVIDRFALADRYAPEFDRIGNNRRAMRELADRTRGRVIEPTDVEPLDLPGPIRRLPLTSELAFGGAALIAMGLIHWRRST